MLDDSQLTFYSLQKDIQKAIVEGGITEQQYLCMTKGSPSHILGDHSPEDLQFKQYNERYGKGKVELKGCYPDQQTQLLFRLFSFVEQVKTFLDEVPDDLLDQYYSYGWPKKFGGEHGLIPYTSDEHKKLSHSEQKVSKTLINGMSKNNGEGCFLIVDIGDVWTNRVVFSKEMERAMIDEDLHVFYWKLKKPTVAELRSYISQAYSQHGIQGFVVLKSQNEITKLLNIGHSGWDDIII